MERALGLGLGAMVALRAVQLGGFAAHAGIVGDDDVFSGRPTSIAIVAAVAVVQIALVLLFVRRVPATLGELGWRVDRPALRVAQGLGGFAVIAAVMVSVLRALDVPLEGLLAFMPGQRVTFVMIGLLAAFVEETVFRGMIQPSLQSTRLGPIGGLVATAVIFDLYHLALAPVALVIKLTIGLVLGVLRWRTGTLVAGAIAHALVWIVFGSL